MKFYYSETTKQRLTHLNILSSYIIVNNRLCEYTDIGEDVELDADYQFIVEIPKGNFYQISIANITRTYTARW